MLSDWLIHILAHPWYAKCVKLKKFPWKKPQYFAQTPAGQYVCFDVYASETPWFLKERFSYRPKRLRCFVPYSNIVLTVSLQKALQIEEDTEEAEKFSRLLNDGTKYRK